jgi:peptide/nickel transport system substrate-binding protein
MSKLIFLIATVLFLTSCNSNNNLDSLEKNNNSIQFGGNFKISEIESASSFYPPSVTDIRTTNIINQVYETLVKLDSKDMSLQPSIAKKWNISEDGLTYTFNIKKGIKFHDNECFPAGQGRELTAIDVQYSLTNICTFSNDNKMFNTTLKGKLLGANEYYNASKTTNPDFQVAGIKVIDNYTIELTLEKPNSSFLYILAMPSLSIIPEEGVQKYGNKLALGSGPFTIPANQDLNSDKLLLLKNKNYHMQDSLGNQLPYLDSISIEFVQSKRAQLEQFKSNKIDLVVGLPSGSIKSIVEEHIADFRNDPPKFILERSPEMSTQYYSFNHTRKVFQDIRVRKAFNLAIDRTKIVEEVLKGEAYAPGVNGITPPTLKGYNVNDIKGYDFDIEQAKDLLAKAGYPNGEGFPSIKLELNSGGKKNTSIALEIQKQLRQNLGIMIELEIVPMAKKLDDERYARADIFRAGWVADYPDPISFLNLFYGANVPESLEDESYPNTSRYTNPKFDKYFNAGTNSSDNKEKYNNFLLAEQELMNDAALMVLYYGESYVLMQSNVRNFHLNPLNYRDYSQVYFKEMKAKKVDK